MPILHDLQCKGCGWESPETVLVPSAGPPPCPSCRHKTEPRYDAWNTMVLDCYSTPKYFDAAGRSFSSTREKERFMYKEHRIGTAERGRGTVRYEPSGDRVHGARPDHTLKDKGFSYAGQKNRSSSGERKQARGA